MNSVKHYDAIAIGTGSVMAVVNGFIQYNPDAKVAVVDKDKPGGICLTKGCIPSKILVYPAELISDIEKAKELGIDVELRGVDFGKIMGRMRRIVDEDVEEIEKALNEHPNIDYYKDVATFTAPYELKVGDERIRAEKIFIGSGSKPLIPNIKGLGEAGFITSDTLLQLEEMPDSLAIIGGGYIAVEYGNFFARLGCDVKIIEMFPRILYNEEPELSQAVQEELGRIAEIYTSHKVVEVRKKDGLKKVVAAGSGGRRDEVEAEEVLVAAGRAPNSDVLKPENGGIKTDSKGWIIVNEYLETSMPGVYALGDANGKYMFKHVANHEARVVLENAVLGRRRMMNYDVVPHAAFTQPEIASVGLKEAEAVERYSRENVLIGYERYKTTGKGLAMNAKGFVKVIVRRDGRILGAHIAGKYASVMIQEIVNLMVAGAGVSVMLEAMHIHPSLSEAVMWAFGNLMGVEEYHRMLAEFRVSS